MATVTIPTKLLENKKVLNAFIEAFHQGKFLPGYWVNNLPNAELGNIKLFTNGNLVLAEVTMVYPGADAAFKALSLIMAYINSSDREIISKAGRERNLVYFTYNFLKL